MVGEMREDERIGKSTSHFAADEMTNWVYVNGESISENYITDEDEAFYNNKGIPVKALAPNWKDY